MFDGLIFKIADERERSQALELRRTVYEEELGHDGIDRFDEAAYHLVACDSDGNVAAALRVVGPAQRPFDFEQIVVLSDYLPDNRSPGEISRFCVLRDHRQVRSDHFIQIGMLKLAHAFARKHGLTDFVTLALPHLRNLYRIAFFQPLGAPREHPMWGRVHPMRLDLVDLEARHSQSKQPLARLLFATDLPNILV